MSRPTPPDDLWEQLDALQRTISAPKHITPPPNSFTREQYQERYKLTHWQASEQLRRLLELNLVRKHRIDKQTFWILQEN